MNKTTRWRNILIKHRVFLAAFGILVSAQTAYAFDCKQAATASEKAICADPAALASDTALSDAFKTLRASLSASQAAELLKSQQSWVKQRDSNCGESTPADLAKCLKEQTDLRAETFNTKPKAGPGGFGTLVPFFRSEVGGKGKTKVQIQVYKFANPSDAAQKTFNKEIDKLIGDIPLANADDDSFDFSVDMSLDYVSPKLISAHTATSSYLGGPHPSNQSTTINIDVRKGAVAKFKDFLDNPAATKIAALCAKQVLQQKKESQGADLDLSEDTLKKLSEDIANANNHLELWTFAADKAEIQYDQYVVGAYSEGAFACDIPYSDLRPVVKKDFPLP